MCNCNCNPNVHRVTAITVGTGAVDLSVTNNTNVGNSQPFVLLISKCKSATLPAGPLPVTVTLNGTAIPLLDQNGRQILSNKIPRNACGEVVLVSSAADAPATPPYVILYNTPKRFF